MAMARQTDNGDGETDGQIDRYIDRYTEIDGKII
jgi:hypothetical protein